jgi:hypothetical protein
MSLWDKIFGKRVQGSGDFAWALPMTVDQRTTFLELVSQAIARAGETAHIENGVVHLRNRQLQMGLSNLAQLCATRPVADWPPMIQEQVTRSLGFDFGAKQPLDFEAVRDQLRLRFRPYGHPHDDAFWGRVLAPGLTVNLVLDWPDRVQTVTTEQVSQWAQPAEEVWQTALANLARREALPSPKRYVVSLTEPSPAELAYYHFEGDSLFIAAHALRLPTVDTGHPRLGWIFMVPNRHTLLLTSIMNLPECGAALLMLMQGASLLVSRPGLISDQLYWTDGDRFEHLSRPDGLSGYQVVERLQETLKRLTSDAG